MTNNIDSPRKIDEEYYEVVKPKSLSERAMIRAREDIYRKLIELCNPNDSDKIIDVGVSDIIESGDNMLERLYPHKKNMTAAGLGDGIGFREAFPDINYVNIVQGEPLPFEDKSFKLAVSNAVLEHVGSSFEQAHFVAELIRISQSVFISVPNRYFPIEHHTALPFFAWSDVTFSFGCKLMNKSRWAEKANLNLMSLGKLKSLIPINTKARYGYAGLGLGPFSSNLYAIIESK